jgi:acyl-CoA synthetase (NDP forming)
VDNPADLTGDVISHPEVLDEVLEIVGADDATDAVILQFANQGVAQAAQVEEKVIRLAQSTGKPVALGFVAGLPDRALCDRLQEHGVLTFEDPAAVGRSLGWLARQRARAGAIRDAPPLPATPDAEPHPGDSDWESLAALMERHGIRTAASRIVSDEDEARAAIGELGLPLAAKLPTDEYAHKTELGGVRLGLRDEAEVLEAFRELAGMPDRTSTRVHLQAHVPDGIEVLLSARHDPDLGPMIAAGPGGVYVELLGDLAYRLLPASRADLEELVDETRLGQLLAGFRGRPAADRQALVDAMLGLSELLRASPWLDEIELNPLIVLPAGSGLYAVDLAVELAAV